MTFRGEMVLGGGEEDAIQIPKSDVPRVHQQSIKQPSLEPPQKGDSYSIYVTS